MTSLEKNTTAETIVLESLPDVPAVKLQRAIDAELPVVRSETIPVPATPATLGRPKKGGRT